MPTDCFIPSLSRTRAANANGWSSDQIRQLRDLAQQGVPLSAIAVKLRRSESAVRNKAGLHGISLQRRASATDNVEDLQPLAASAQRKTCFG